MQPVLPQAGKDTPEGGNMVLPGFAVHQNVIDVTDHTCSVTENPSHHPAENRRGVHHAEGHDSELIKTCPSGKGGQWLGIVGQRDLPKSCGQIHL